MLTTLISGKLDQEGGAALADPQSLDAGELKLDVGLRFPPSASLLLSFTLCPPFPCFSPAGRCILCPSPALAPPSVSCLAIVVPYHLCLIPLTCLQPFPSPARIEADSHQ
eukprot:767438-Hanusia_phi.AAC.8